MPIYMKYDGVTGAGTGKYNGWIILESCQLGDSRLGNSNRNKDIVVSKFQDNSSTLLIQESSRGEGKKVTIDFVGMGESIPYLSIELENVMMSSYSVGGHSGESARPMESLSLNFTKITYTSKPTISPKDPKHAKDKAAWNFAVQDSRYS